MVNMHTDVYTFVTCISLDGRFLAVIVTPNPCRRHVCFMSVTKEIHVNDPISMDRMLLIGKHFANEGFLIFEHAAGSLHCFPSIDA